MLEGERCVQEKNIHSELDQALEVIQDRELSRFFIAHGDCSRRLAVHTNSAKHEGYYPVGGVELRHELESVDGLLNIANRHENEEHANREPCGNRVLVEALHAPEVQLKRALIERYHD